MTYEQKLTLLAEKDERIVILTAENRAAIRNLPKAIGRRFIDTGITEQTMVGAAAGLALRGRIPIVHALATFLTMRAFEFIRTDIGIANLPVKLIGYVPGFLSEANGPTHQAVEDISLMRGIPNMKIFCPADEDELVDALPSIIADNAPWYIRYNNLKPIVRHYSEFKIGHAEVLSDGFDVALLTYGLLNRESWCAKEILEKNGLSVRFVNFRTVKPIDIHEIISAAKECEFVVTIEDHFVTGGLHSIVAETLLNNRLTVKTLAIALNNTWFKPALLNDVILYEGFSGEHIAEKILYAMNNTAVLQKENSEEIFYYGSQFEQGE